MTGASKSGDSRITRPLRESTMIIKVVGWGVGVSEGEIVVVGDGLMVGVFVFVWVNLVAVGDDIVLGELVGECCIV